MLIQGRRQSVLASIGLLAAPLEPSSPKLVSSGSALLPSASSTPPSVPGPPPTDPPVQPPPRLPGRRLGPGGRRVTTREALGRVRVVRRVASGAAAAGSARPDRERQRGDETMAPSTPEVWPHLSHGK